jgi:hypothetical protein
MTRRKTEDLLPILLVEQYGVNRKLGISRPGGGNTHIYTLLWSFDLEVQSRYGS